MEQLDRRGDAQQLPARRRAVVAVLAEQQHEGGPQPLAAAPYEVQRHLAQPGVGGRDRLDEDAVELGEGRPRPRARQPVPRAQRPSAQSA